MKYLFTVVALLSRLCVPAQFASAPVQPAYVPARSASGPVQPAYVSAQSASVLVQPAYVSAQSGPALFAAPDYPQHYFRDPLGIPMSLAANFGELRPNHYHMGLDIRTQHRENLPVYAAADGYIARVEIGPFGFGQAIYIHHPNGYTTVYGHLNRFVPALAEYVEREQYRHQSWQVDLTIPPGLFPVKQGEQIAWSGSTGGSQGPHLHFEIRLTAGDINCNPLLFGLPVEDRVPPKITRLAWYDGNRGVYDQSPHLLPVEFGHLSVGTVLTVPVSCIRLAIAASDAQSGSSNPNGIYRAELYDNGRAVIGFEMDHISYNDTRNINAHIDYKTRITGGPFLQQLFFLPGYPFPSIYRIPGPGGGIDPAGAGSGVAGAADNPAGTGSGVAGGADNSAGAGSGVAAKAADGRIDLSDGDPHSIVIAVTDTRGNVSRLSFGIVYRPGAVSAKDSAARADDSVIGKRFYPGMIDGEETADYAFFLGEKSLYDSARIGITVAGYPGSGLSLPGGITPVYAIGPRWIPLLDPILVRLRLPDSSERTSPLTAGDQTATPAERAATLDDKAATPTRRTSTTIGGASTPSERASTPTGESATSTRRASTPTGRIVMVCFNGEEKDVKLPEWKGMWASARFGEFGNFQLVYDSIPPVITPIGPLEGANLSHANRIAFRIRDNLGALRRFRAELDGRWLCFTNDKALAYIYTFDAHCPRGPHRLTVSVEDVAGNRTEKEYHFNR